MNEWVNVKDRLPPLETPVWLSDGGDPWVGVLSDDVDGESCWCNCYGDFFRHAGEWKTDTAEFDDEYTVTHWMLLPEPPNTLVSGG